MKPMKIVSLARDVKRPTTKEWIKAVFDDFIELHGDRYYAVSVERIRYELFLRNWIYL